MNARSEPASIAADLFEPLDAAGLGELVYQKLADALMKGALKPGERLRIRDIARQVDTSVTPVRDAIIRLVQEGALTMRSARDIRVPFVGADRYREIRLIRLQLEGLAAEGAARAATRDDLARLAAIIAENERAIADRDVGQAIALNQVFHFALAEIAGLPTLRGILRLLWLKSGPVIAAGYHVGGRVMIDHHYSVLDAIRRKDAESARIAICRDIMAGGDVILSTGLQEEEQA